MTARRPARPRPRHPMPADVRHALVTRGLMTRYRDRPPYQRNNYPGVPFQNTIG
jgi:hypothetical protein